jgi:hypothetical protein
MAHQGQYASGIGQPEEAALVIQAGPGLLGMHEQNPQPHFIPKS